jgi:hypothetical protein
MGVLASEGLEEEEGEGDKTDNEEEKSARAIEFAPLLRARGCIRSMKTELWNVWLSLVMTPDHFGDGRALELRRYVSLRLAIQLWKSGKCEFSSDLAPLRLYNFRVYD